MAMQTETLSKLSHFSRLKLRGYIAATIAMNKFNLEE